MNPAVVTTFNPLVSAHLEKLTRAANGPGKFEAMSGPDAVNELAPSPEVIAEFSRLKLADLSPADSANAVRRHLPAFAKLNATAFITTGSNAYLVAIRPLDLFTANHGIEVVTAAFWSQSSADQYKMLQQVAATCRLGASCTAPLSRLSAPDVISGGEALVLAGFIFAGLSVAGVAAWKGGLLDHAPRVPPREPDPRASMRATVNLGGPIVLENNGRMLHSGSGKLVSFVGAAPPTTSIDGTIDKIDRVFWTGTYSAVSAVTVRGSDGLRYVLRTTPTHLDASGLKVGDPVVATIPKGEVTVYREGPVVILEPFTDVTNAKGEESRRTETTTTATIRAVDEHDGRLWLILECGDGVVRRRPITKDEKETLDDLALTGKKELTIVLTTNQVSRSGRGFKRDTKDLAPDANVTSIERK